MNYNFWLKNATNRLIHSESPRRDAEILLSFVTGCTRSFLLAFNETKLTLEQERKLEFLLARRELCEPIAYLIGEREFWSLSISVSPSTLIPRPDTERLVALSLDCLPTVPCYILDLGTGTGAIALALASERSDCMIIGVDIQPDSVKLAKYNAEKLKIKNIQFLKSNWFDSLIKRHRFSLIVSNPPYIDVNDLYLMKTDLTFEPMSSLIAEKKGLAHLDIIISQASQYLQSKGWLLVEHGFQQGVSVRSLFLAAGFVSIKTYRDYGNNERVTLGQWNK